MSGLKNFLNRRAEGIAREKSIKEGVDPDDYVVPKTETKVMLDHELGFIEYEVDVEDVEDALDLTDDEFWDISNQFTKAYKNNSSTSTMALQEILKNYSPLKIKQFGERYRELNS